MFVTQHADNSFALRNLTVQDHLRNHPRERLHIADSKRDWPNSFPRKENATSMARRSCYGEPKRRNQYPSKNEVRNEVGLDVSHHTRFSQRVRGEAFFLTSSLS